MNFAGLGTDIIEIERVKKAAERHPVRFLERLFTLRERHYCSQFKDPYPHLAARFAAKEAVFKALGTGLAGAQWTDVEILNDAVGAPKVHLSGHLKEVFPTATLYVTLSHCRAFATATAILEK